MNPSFNIQATEIDFNSAQLFAEAGPTGISLAVMDNANCFKAVVTYAFAAGLTDHELTEQLQAICKTEYLLQQQYGKAHLFWTFTESMLVPAELMNTGSNTDMMNLVFGDAKPGLIRSDFLYKHNLHNLYRLPGSVAGIFSACLPLATQTHVYAALANRNMPEGDHLFAVFFTNSLIILLSKEGRLQLIQSFAYTHADDCVFHLLNVCKGFEVQPGSATLHINGMIDERSELYAAIYKYFLNISFDTRPAEYTYSEDIKNIPAHFFSHLFELASCV